MAQESFYIVGERGYVLSLNEGNSVTLLEKIGTKNQLWNWDGCRLISEFNSMVLTVNSYDEVIMSAGNTKDLKTSQEWKYHDYCLQHCSGKILSAEIKGDEENCRILVSAKTDDQDQLWLLEPRLSKADIDVLLSKEPTDENPLSILVYWIYILQQRLKDICGYNIAEYEKLVADAIREMSKCADHLDEVNDDTSFTRGAGAGMGVTGSVAGLCGLALAPFTAGISLTLTLAGAITAAGGGATQLTGTIINKVWEKKDKEKARESAIRAAKITQTLQELMAVFRMKLFAAREFLKCHPTFLEDNPSIVEKFYNYGQISGKAAYTTYNVVSVGLKVFQGLDTHKELMSMVKAITLKDLQGFKTGLASSTAAPKVAIPFGRTLAQAGSAGAKLFSGVLGFVGLGLSIWSMLDAESDRKKKSALAREIRKSAETLEKISKETVKQFNELFQM